MSRRRREEALLEAAQPASVSETNEKLPIALNTQPERYTIQQALGVDRRQANRRPARPGQ